MATTDLHKHWGERLRAQRTAAGLTPTALALTAGITRHALWNYENGRRVIPDTLRPALAKALGVDVVELFPYELSDDAA